MKYSTLHWSIFNIGARLFGIMSLLCALAFFCTGILQFCGVDIPTPGVPALGNLLISIFGFFVSLGFLTVRPYRPDLINQNNNKQNTKSTKINWWTGGLK